jgi:PAS domain S-box-containing protein
MSLKPPYDKLEKRVQALEATNAKLAREKAELEEVDTQWKLFAENLHEVLYVLDLNGVATYVSPNIRNFTGLRPEDIIGRKYTDFVHPEDLPDRQRNFEKILSGESIVSEARYVTQDGGYIWTRTQGQAIYENGHAVGVLGVMADITEQKRLATTLHRAKNQWENTFDALSDWVSIIDKNHTIIRSNKASKGIASLPAWEVTGKPCFEVVHGTAGPVVDCPAERAFVSHQREEMVFLLENDRWVQVVVEPIRDTPEDNKQFVHIVKDITDLKKREQAVVSDRKTEAFSILAGGLAHDFNNLLAIIRGYISLVETELSDPYLLDSLHEADTACEQAKKLTYQFLTLSKGAILEKTECDLKALLLAAVDDVLPKGQFDANLDVRVENAPVVADQHHVRTALRNIVQNAVEADPGGTLHIRMEKAASPVDSGFGDTYFKITFQDTGKGIRSSDLPKVFDPYFSTKGLGSQKGRGLGLSVAQTVIEKHGGTIAVDSSPNQGTLVSVHFPSPEAESQLIEQQIHSLPPGKPVILMMEDDTRLRRLCKMMLERLDFGVIAASNAEAVFILYKEARAKKIPIQLILFDQVIKGGGHGGTETLQRLRREGFTGKAVVITGSPSSSILNDFKQYGFDAKILKPYTDKDLEKIIRSVLSDG